MARLFENISFQPNPQKITIWPRIASTPSHIVVVKYKKSDICCPLKVRLEEHRKAVCGGDVEKSDIADHIRKEKGNHLPLWDEVKTINREEHKIRLKEAAHKRLV